MRQVNKLIQLIHRYIQQSIMLDEESCFCHDDITVNASKMRGNYN